MQAGRERLVFDDSFELDAGLGSLPGYGVTGLDVKIDEEEGGYGRQVGKGDDAGALGESYVKPRLATA